MKSVVAKKVETFFKQYPLVEFDKGQALIHAEEEPSGVFYLVEGRVNQYDIAPSGTEVIVNVFKPHAFFPMSWVLNRGRNRYFFGACDHVTAYKAPVEDVLAFVRTEPDVMFDLMTRVFSGVEGVLRRAAHVMGGDARTRLLFELLNAAERFGEVRDDGSVFVPLKEGELAQQSGLARETISRTIRGFKEAGLIEVSRAGYILKDYAKTEAELGTRI